MAAQRGPPRAGRDAPTGTVAPSRPAAPAATVLVVTDVRIGGMARH